MLTKPPKPQVTKMLLHTERKKCNSAFREEQKVIIGERAVSFTEQFVIGVKKERRCM